MKRFLFLIVLALLSLGTKAQHWVWDSLISANSPLKLVRDSSDNIFTYEFQGSDLKKYGLNGKFAWTKPINGSIFNISFDTSDNIYMTGTFSGTMSCDTFSINAYGDEDIFLLKINPVGQAIWLKGIGSVKRDIAGDVCVYGNTIYLCGMAGDNCHFATTTFTKEPYIDLFISKLDSNASPIQVKFSKQLNPDSSMYAASAALEIKNDKKGNLFMLALINEPLQIDTAIINASYLYFLLKFDSALNLTWRKFVVSCYANTAGNLRVNSSGDALLVNNGYYKGRTGRIIKIGANGEPPLNLFIENSGNIFAMDLDNMGHIFLTGFLERSSYSGNPPPTYFLNVWKITESYQQLWNVCDSSQFYRAGYGIAALKSGYCFVYGQFQNNITLHNTLYGNSADVDHFFAILDQPPLMNVNTRSKYDHFKVFPNPTDEMLYFLNAPDRNYFVTDVSGKIIKRGLYTAGINVSDLANGIYFVNLKNKAGCSFSVNHQK